ncbi:MAG: hypothetical protein HYU67_05265 [Flavobacteriia bacterium]|nr:hypothetical protein [Flavobacteriia bacterium]
MRLSFLFYIIPFFLFSQQNKTFEGKLIYQVNFVDSINFHNNFAYEMKIFTNDTLVRIETESVQLGKQILIKHLIRQKYYVLLEYEEQKYAIQHHILPDSTKNKTSFKYTFKKKNVNNLRLKKVKVRYLNKDINEIFVYPKISSKYVDVFKGIKGLPAIYSLPTEMGTYTYELKSVVEEKCPIDLFGIPSDYKKISFDQFINEITNKKESEK